MTEPFVPWTRNRLLAFLVVLLFGWGLLFTKAGHNFMDAWRLWATANKPISDYYLWHLPILWWGRIGKILEVAGVFFLLFDAFGYSNARAFLQMFSEPGTVQDHVCLFKDTYEEVRIGLRNEPVRSLLTFLNNYLFVFVLTGFLSIPIFHLLAWKSRGAGPLSVFLLGLGSFLLSALVLAILTSIAGRPLYRIAKSERRVRLLNFFVVLIGLMFDLLSV